MTHEGGETMLRYIKALNPEGYTVYVIPDIEGVTLVHKKDEIFEISEQGNTIPYASKSGALKCSGDTCNVVLECGNGQVCMVSKDKVKQEAIEETLVVSSSDKSVTGSDIYPYPVVKLSEIQKSPKNTLLKTAETANRFRRLNGTLARDSIEALGMSIHNVGVSYSKLIPEYRAAFKGLSASTSILAQYRRKYEERADIYAKTGDEKYAPTENDKTAVEAIGFNIGLRNDMLDDILGMSAEFETLSVKLNGIQQKLLDRVEEIQSKYSKIGNVYE